MSRYTTNFRSLINGGFVTRNEIEGIFKSYNLTDYLTPEEINVINTRGTWTPDKLARKIVDHYYLKDIGFETYTMFKHYAMIQMQEIMESKLPLIYSASIKYDPMINVNYTEQFSRTIDNTGSDTSITNTTNNTNQTNSGTNNTNQTNSGSNNTNQNGSGSATSNGSSLTVNSDTPQGQISKETILDGSYASSTSAIENENTTTTTDSITINNTTTDSTTINNTTSDTLTNNNTINSNVNNSNTNNMQEGSIKTVKGNSGVSATSQKMILQYRENIIAIDKEIIEELNDLFMGLF